MSISEGDISVLIPTYRYRAKVTRALASAISSGAGEIIIVDDCSDDGTIEALKEFTDPRIRIIENERNLGLWENHLRALSLARLPWIKFLQADDYLLPGGLKMFADAVGPNVTVVCAVANLVDEETERSWRVYHLRERLHLGWTEFASACYRFGNFLGSPSYMLLRADVVSRDSRLWRRDMSADMIIGVLAALQGDVVILPPGAIGHESHAQQDAHTQGAALGFARLANSLNYLNECGHVRAQEIAKGWALLTLRPALRSLARSLTQRDASQVSILRSARRYISALLAGGVARTFSVQWEVRVAHAYRKKHHPPYDLDQVFASSRAEP